MNGRNCLFLLLAVLATTAQAEPARNVIILFGDGMGAPHLEVARCYLGTALACDSFPYTSQVETVAMDMSMGDSASGATCVFTGHNVNGGVISKAIPPAPGFVYGEDYETILEYMMARGASSGILTPKHINDATPACLATHDTNRFSNSEILDDYLIRARPNLLWGGSAFQKKMSVALATSNGYSVVTNRSQLLALPTNSANVHSCGLFGSDTMNFEYDGMSNQPHLSEMTRQALHTLDKDPDGFILMVEGGLIDIAGHENNLQRLTHEMVEFNNVIATTMAWASNRTDTLVVIVADHETGGLTNVVSNGAGNYPTVSWVTTWHTDKRIPTFAWGVGASNLVGCKHLTDVYDVLMGNAPEHDPLPQGNKWYFRDTGVDPGTNWMAPTFNSSSWTNDVAPLGYASAGTVASNRLATFVSFGTSATNKHITTWFRTSFLLDSAILPSNVSFHAMIDDGARVWLNGQSVWTYNMPTGTITAQTKAATSITGDAVTNVLNFSVGSNYFVIGTNWLTVEVHQQERDSSDLFFDLWADDLPEYGKSSFSNGVTSTAVQWTAYNDMYWQSGQLNYRISALGVTGSSAPLIDHDNGLNLSAMVSFSGVETTLNATTVPLPAGSDAERMFGGRVTTDSLRFWTSGTYSMTFSNLVPSQRYTFALYGDRGLTNANYTSRWTDVTITDVSNFVNNSSAGARRLTNSLPQDTTRILAANTNGLLFRFTDIAPGSDGDVVFNLTAGGTSSTSSYINAFMFAALPMDANTNGVPDDWEQAYFGGTNSPYASGSQDWDQDGFDNYSEYWAGTDPTSAVSCLALFDPRPTNSLSDLVLRWSGVTNRSYSVLYSTNLISGWNVLKTSIPGVAPVTTYTSTVGSANGFWKIRVE